MALCLPRNCLPQVGSCLDLWYTVAVVVLAHEATVRFFEDSKQVNSV